MKNKKKKKVSGNSKRKRTLFKKNKRKITEIKNSKKIKDILPEKIESGLEKEIEDTIPRFKDILKETESSPVLERVAETQENLEQDIASASVSAKKEDEKINYFSNQENLTYLSEPRRERTNNIEYPSSSDLSEISARAAFLKPLHDFRNVVNETTVRKEKFLDTMRGNIINTMDNREKTFDVFDKGYIDNESEEKKYNEFKQ